MKRMCRGTENTDRLRRGMEDSFSFFFLADDAGQDKDKYRPQVPHLAPPGQPYREDEWT